AQDSSKLPWDKFLSEFVGTAMLVLVGLSMVIFMHGTGSPMVALIPDLRQRLTVTGFLFGTIGGSIALSQVGKVSGAHINPVVTFGFWMMGKIATPVAVGYAIAQMVGGVIGSLPLLAWGSMGRSVEFGATAPGTGYSITAALLGEA